jgi:hypothetical protein
LVNDQPLPGEPAATQEPSTPVTSAPTTTTSAAPTGLTVDPASIKLTILNLSGRSGVATEAMGLLDNLGFGVTDQDLQAPDQQTQSGVTVEYDPANISQALTVAAAVPGATLVPTAGLGTQVRLLLGESFSGTVTAVHAGVEVTGTLATGANGSVASGPSTGTLSSGELTSINAGDQLCA